MGYGPGWLCAEGPARVVRGIPDHRHLCRKTKLGRTSWGRTRLIEWVIELYQIELQLVLVADLLTCVALVTELLLLVVLLLGFGATCLWSWGLGQSLCLQSLVTLFGG